MSRLRVALVGAGTVSRHHLIAWSQRTDVEIVAITDPVIERARARAQEFGVSNVYDRVSSMLDEVRPDALDVATPVGTHYSVVVEAVERGIAVVCQKPLAATVEEAQAIANRAAGHVRLMVHENWRSGRNTA